MRLQSAFGSTIDPRMPIAADSATATFVYSAAPSAARMSRDAQQRALFIVPGPQDRGTFVVTAGHVSTTVADTQPPPLSEQSAADVAVGQLLRMGAWEKDWDGNQAAKPLGFSLRQAREFVRALSAESTIPRPALHADGHAILFLRQPDVYAELEFLGDQRVSFYARRGEQEWTDEFSFAGGPLPRGLLEVGLAV
jgi:hypothetical protein